MQDVVDKLYNQYNENISYFLSKDEFYQYFHNLLETGTTYCQFFNRKLVKRLMRSGLRQLKRRFHIYRQQWISPEHSLRKTNRL